jgi:catechol 2,3-dioxygenase-like lactoylglutathione lyase family enzyme
MACRISELVIKCRDPQRLAAFWCEVLGFRVLNTDYGAVAAIPPEGFGGLQPTLIFIPTPEPRTGNVRLHFDVNATDRDQEGELERLLNLGARRPTSVRPVRSPGSSWPTPRGTNSASWTAV